MARRGPSALNLLIGIDKPSGMTSHDAVGRVRRALGERRVGHAGTLDPLATGVLVVGVGQATRLLGLLSLDTKAYLAQIFFGSETATDDAEGAVTRTAETPRELLDTAFAATAVGRLVGAHEQVPPAYSAISIDGVRSYTRARAGEEVELAARPIEVFDARLLHVEERDGQPLWTVAFTVSKGTYIRALARDLGRNLGSAAHLVELRRTTSGTVGLGSCLALDEVSPCAARTHALDPVSALGVLCVPLAERWRDDILCGRRIPRSAVPQLDDAVFDAAAAGGEPASLGLVIGNELAALAHADAGALVMDHVFPQPIGGVRR